MVTEIRNLYFCFKKRATKLDWANFKALAASFVCTFKLPSMAQQRGCAAGRQCQARAQRRGVLTSNAWQAHKSHTTGHALPGPRAASRTHGRVNVCRSQLVRQQGRSVGISAHACCTHPLHRLCSRLCAYCPVPCNCAADLCLLARETSRSSSRCAGVLSLSRGAPKCRAGWPQVAGPRRSESWSPVGPISTTQYASTPQYVVSGGRPPSPCS